jgi:Flp pilus assembly protein TadD
MFFDQARRRPLNMPAPVLAFVLALGLAAAGAPAQAADTDSSPAPQPDEYANGKKAVDRKDWSGAIRSFRAVIAKEPTHADAHNMLGYSYRSSGDLTSAMRHYQEALRLLPNHRGAHEYIGQAYLMMKQPDKAREHLARLESICGTGCEEYRDLAKAIANYQP